MVSWRLCCKNPTPCCTQGVCVCFGCVFFGCACLFVLRVGLCMLITHAHKQSHTNTHPPHQQRITSGVRPIQLLVNSGLLKQGERVCYRTKTGPAKLWGTIHGYDILCDGCGKLNSCLEFERCAGSNNKKPTRHIFTESMRCMQDMIAEAKSVNAPGNAGPIIVPR